MKERRKKPRANGLRLTSGSIWMTTKDEIEEFWRPIWENSSYEVRLKSIRTTGYEASRQL